MKHGHEFHEPHSKRAMIPHHSAAIQMCRESDISDPRVCQLCEEIVFSQERDITQMRALLSEKK